MKGFDLSQSRDDPFPFPFPFRNEKKYADRTIGFYLLLYSAGYMIMYVTVMIALLRNLYDN
jgi:hypothetical protein